MKLQKILEFLLKLFTVIGLAYFPVLIILAIINTFVEFPVNLSELSAEVVLSPFFVLGALVLVLSIIFSILYPSEIFKYEEREIKFKKVSTDEFVQEISKVFDMDNPKVFGTEACKLVYFEKVCSAVAEILWFLFADEIDEIADNTYQNVRTLMKEHGDGGQRITTVSFFCSYKDISQSICNKSFNIQDMYGRTSNISFIVDLTRGNMFYSHMNDGPGMFAQRKMEKNVYNALKNCEIFEETDLEILLKKRIKTERKSDKK